jgi:uncharacterized protein (DUF2235 family)
MKRIVICADGTWNRPEQDIEKDFPTNVLKVSRAVKPVADDGTEQVVFYDWGIGSYYGNVSGGATGKGINKNIQDGYRFIVQNYDPGDHLYFFGFSRGAYTVRSLSGLIYNCGILERSHANRIHEAFELYKSSSRPTSPKSKRFRRDYSRGEDARVRFIGVWDTVGALGIPLSFAGFLNDDHHFHDNKIGPNIDCARHALAIDEKREDFEPTIWKSRPGLDLKQVWFCGVHTDVGGGYIRPGRGALSDIALKWMMREARANELGLEKHLDAKLRPKPTAKLHDSYKGFMKLLGKSRRKIKRSTWLHASVKERYLKDSGYRPKPLVDYVKRHGWDRLTD